MDFQKVPNVSQIDHWLRISITGQTDNQQYLMTKDSIHTDKAK